MTYKEEFKEIWQTMYFLIRYEDLYERSSTVQQSEKFCVQQQQQKVSRALKFWILQGDIHNTQKQRPA